MAGAPGVVHPAQQIVFQEYVRTVTERTELLGRLEAQLLEQARLWRFYPVVEALQALRGVQFTVAVIPIAELGTSRASPARGRS